MGRGITRSGTSETRPNLFVVGAPKCATTSLHRYLNQHPAIFMSPTREPRYWSDDLRDAGHAFHRDVLRSHLTSVRRWQRLPQYLLQRRKVRPRDLDEEPEVELDRLFGFLGIDQIAAELDLRRSNVSGSPSSCPRQTVIDALHEELEPVVARLESQTGLELRRRWGYDR